MRRKDREINSKTEIEAIIGRCPILIIGLADENQPYAIPVNFVYKKEDKVFYFHSAKEGRKIDLINTNNNCCFTLYNDMGVDHGDVPEKTTNYYESIMGTGKIIEVVDLSEKRLVVELLMARYGYENYPNVDETTLNKTYFGKIIIDSISGKANRRKTG